MIKFMMQCFVITIVLLVGVIVGMQQANQGMKKMQGYDDPSLQSAFHISDSSNGEVEASVLGKKVTSHDLEEKQKQLEEMKAFNFFSSIGKKMGEGISSIFEKIMLKFSEGVTNIIDKTG